jgi:two-component system cell cycle sensor histidine kinase/response regulator CckA
MARIMIVEDEPITVADLEHQLTALGHQVVAWSDTGEEAVAQADALAPDLILMDIRLRGQMTGIEAAQRVREHAEVPIVFLTAFSDRDTVGRACETLPYGYLLKPFTERAVDSALQVALARAGAERERLERERWLTQGLRSVGEALLAVDTRGAIRFLNEQAEALLEVKARDVLGKPVRSVIRFAGNRATADHPLELALAEGRVSSSPGRTLELPSGKAGPVISYSSAPMLSATQSRVGAVLAFHEVTGEEGSPSIGGLTALNTLSRQLAHEINNPLTYSIGALRLALRELDQLRLARSLGAEASDPRRLQREEQLTRLEGHLHSAQEGAARVALVMRELTSFSLAERDMIAVEPAEVLELALGLTGLDAVQRARLQHRLRSAPAIRGNKWQLAQALAFALQHAANDDASRGALETLSVALGTDARGWAELRVTARRSPDSPEPAARAQLSSDVLRPTGVGLALAQQVVASHGGELVVRDERAGRTVDLRLPPLRSEASREERARAEHPPEHTRLLVIDDEPLIGRVLELSLKPQCEVISVQSAEAGLALIESGRVYDVILCDLSMPRMSGQDFYERLCELRPDLARQVILMTGGACDERGASFVKQMAGRCLIKPFSTEQLLPLVAERVRMRESASAPASC